MVILHRHHSPEHAVRSRNSDIGREPILSVNASRVDFVDFAKAILPNEDEIRAVLQAAAAGPKAALDLVARIPAEGQAVIFRSLVWLVKLGVMKVF